MKLSSEFTVSNKVKIGYSSLLCEYILSVEIEWSTNYKRYFRLSESEYNGFKSSSSMSKKILSFVKEEGIQNKRFLYSERVSENNEKQLDTLRMVYTGDSEISKRTFKYFNKA